MVKTCPSLKATFMSIVKTGMLGTALLPLGLVFQTVVLVSSVLKHIQIEQG